MDSVKLQRKYSKFYINIGNSPENILKSKGFGKNSRPGGRGSSDVQLCIYISLLISIQVNMRLPQVL